MYRYHDGGLYNGEWVDDKVGPFFISHLFEDWAWVQLPQDIKKGRALTLPPLPPQIHGQGEREYAIGNKVQPVDRPWVSGLKN